MITSSKYAAAKAWWGRNIRSINRWNVAGSPQRQLLPQWAPLRRGLVLLWQPRPQQQPKSTRSHGAAVGLVPAAETQQHRQLQVQCEALAVVLQKTLAERDDAMRQCREQSQELVTLRGELVSSVQSCQRVEQLGEEMRRCLEERLQALQEQHQEDLAQLENRLKVAYQQEWDKVQLANQEEAEKVQNLMEQKMAELKANHDAMRQEVEVRHSEHLQQVQQQFENSVEELRTVHHEELQALDKSRKEADDSLSRRIQELTEENNDLTEKLRIEEEKRREHAEKNQTDSHMLYLQQELESLNVVLDMKTQQLHLQENKVLQMDKLTEKSLKLEECLKRVVQENEELKARMDRHSALTRQLSTDHEVLQESLQKESQVNKRLSRENEELVWKLHNGDLGVMSSPRRTTSPVSPSSHSLGLQSPRSPAFFASSSSPVSPR